MDGPVTLLDVNHLFDLSSYGLLRDVVDLHLVLNFLFDSPHHGLLYDVVDLHLVYFLIMEVINEPPIVVISSICIIHTDMYFCIYHLILIMNEVVSISSYEH